MGSFTKAPSSVGGGISSGDAAPSSASSLPSLPAAKPQAPGGGLLDGLSSGGLKLTAPVGPGAVNNPGDVFRVESILRDAEILDRPPGRAFGDDTLGAIKAAQQRLNSDPRLDLAKAPLKLDGLVNPAGPTEAATRRLAGDVLAGPRPPRPGASPVAPSAAGVGTVATPGGLRRETLEQTAKRFAKGGPLTKTVPAPKPAPDLTASDIASLRRLAEGTRKTTRPGAAAKDIADAFRADGPATAKEFLVVRDALAETGTPEQVKNLTEGVRAELSPDERGRFDRLTGGTDGGGGSDSPLGLKDDGRNPTFNKFRERLRPREGGFSNNPEDKGGPTQKGVSQRLLDRLNEQHPEWDLPEKSEKLNDKQIRGIYRSEFFDKPKIQKVQDIPEIQKQAPQLPEQLFDAGVLHGPKRAGQWLQQSLDERLGTDLRVPDKNGDLVYDGNVGPKTRAAIAQAMKEGEIRSVNNSMADRRVEFMRKLPDFKDNPGWLPRANSFRIRK